MELTIEGQPVVPGEADAEVLASSEPLSFWGGYDQKTGEIIDRRHPLSGLVGAGRIIAVPFTRGSSTTTGILLESVRAGVAPAGIITTEVDTFLALSSIVAGEMYDASFPVVAVGREAFARLRSGARARIETDGSVRLTGSTDTR
jgi:predicted aconitase with swiveling domain